MEYMRSLFGPICVDEDDVEARSALAIDRLLSESWG